MEKPNWKRDGARWMILLLFFSMACGTRRASAVEKVVTDADKGGSIHLKAGEAFELKLKSNPSTGYMWYVMKDSTLLIKLVHQSQEEIPGLDDPGLPENGQPVYQVFKFEAKHFGRGVLTMHYVRSWDPPSPSDKRFDLHVTVE